VNCAFGFVYFVYFSFFWVFVVILDPRRSCQ